MIRAIEPADADVFAALVRQVFAGLPVDPPPSAARLTADDIRSHLADGGGGVTTDPGMAGLLWAEREGGLYVSRVAVAPAQQGRGLATMLLHAAEAEAIRRRLPRVWLSTRLALTGNRAFFGKRGFVETDRHAHPGYAEPTFVDMQKQIDCELNGRLNV